MKSLRIAKLLVLFACLAVFALPILNGVLIAPSFTEFLKNAAEKELSHIATQMAKNITLDEELTSSTRFRKETLDNIEAEREFLNLKKIKIFTRLGQTIYSTDPRDIGKQTTKSFFPAVVEQRQTRSELETTDSNKPNRDVFIVETYVPIIKNDQVTGVFEIYYDSTESRKELSQVVMTINWIVFSVSMLLLLAVLGSAYLTRRSHLLQEKTEAEKDALINELSQAVHEIKALRGILPLCSYCKKIRNDKGYWEQVDVYIDQHSEADITHGICPDCVKEQYPEHYEEILAATDKD